MYSDKDLSRILRKNLDSEMDVIRFYIDNLEGLNFKMNKKQINQLVLDSLVHATLLSEQLLVLGKDKCGKLKSKLKDEAYREERGVRELYRYELKGTTRKDTAKVLARLIKEETEHEKLVDSFK